MVVVFPPADIDRHSTIGLVIADSASVINAEIVKGLPDTAVVVLSVITGGEESVTVKLLELVEVTPPMVTLIFPDELPVGTVVVILVEVLPVTVAAVVLNSTLLFALVSEKLVPVMVTEVAPPPLGGVKLEIAGIVLT